MKVMKILGLFLLINFSCFAMQKTFLAKWALGLGSTIYGAKKIQNIIKASDYKTSEEEIRQIILIKDNY